MCGVWEGSFFCLVITLNKITSKKIKVSFIVSHIKCSKIVTIAIFFIQFLFFSFLHKFCVFKCPLRCNLHALHYTTLHHKTIIMSKKSLSTAETTRQTLSLSMLLRQAASLKLNLIKAMKMIGIIKLLYSDSVYSTFSFSAKHRSRALGILHFDGIQNSQ